MTLMKQAEFADLCGVSRAAVSNWRKDGDLVMEGALVNVEGTHEKMLRYRKGGSPLTGVRVGGVLFQASRPEERQLQSGESPTQAADRIITAYGANMDLDEAKRVKENYLALQAQLEYDRDAGLVVLVEDVAKAVGAEYAKVRSRLLSIPAALAPQLQRMKTAADICDALERAITEAMEELTADGAA